MFIPEFEVGESVRMNRDGKWQPAKVTSRENTPRSYVVNTSEGNSYRRNRRALSKTKIPTNLEMPDCDEIDKYTTIRREEESLQVQSRPVRERKPPVWTKYYHM